MTDPAVLAGKRVAMLVEEEFEDRELTGPRDAMDVGKPVAAICHGPQLLISAGALRGRTLTCWPSIAIDVKNAGGLYVDKPVVEDGNLITSRKPDDVPVFTEAILRALARVHV